MTHTLESLKKILDEGGTITAGSIKINGTDHGYFMEYREQARQILEGELCSFLDNPSEWSEVKAEPSTMAVPIDQWNALNNELEELRTKVRAEEWYKLKAEGFPLKSALEEIKFGFDGPSVGSVSHGQTLDPAAEYAKPYTFLALPAAEIMVGIKAGQTWSNGYYTSSGCNEIGIYFDHKFGTTSVPWELVAGFIEENKIWEKR